MSNGRSTEKMEPCISVVIATKNSEVRIARCLKSIFQQKLQPIEVIVVDGHSTDKTVDIASKFKVRIAYEEYGTAGGARNVGAKLVEGNIIAFTDDDCEAPPDWVSKIRERFLKDSSLVLLGGIDLDASENTTLGRVRGLLTVHGRLRMADGYAAVYDLHGCNLAYRKDIFSLFGGFDPSLKYWEESELNARLIPYAVEKGLHVIFDPEITVNHLRHPGEFFMNVRIFRNGIRFFFRKHVMRMTLKSGLSTPATTYLMLGWSAVLLCVFLVSATVSAQWLLSVFLFEVAASLAILLGYSAWIMRRARRFSGTNELLLIPMVLSVDSLFRLVGLCIGAIEYLVGKLREGK